MHGKGALLENNNHLDHSKTKEDEDDIYLIQTTTDTTVNKRKVGLFLFNFTFYHRYGKKLSSTQNLISRFYLKPLLIR